MNKWLKNKKLTRVTSGIFEDQIFKTLQPIITLKIKISNILICSAISRNERFDNKNLIYL